MRGNSSNTPFWRAALRRALMLRSGRGEGDKRLDLGQAVDRAIRHGADRRRREAAPDAAISNMLRLMAEPGRNRPQSDPAE